MSAGLLLFGLIPLFIAIPLLIYHFLIFPNIDGVMHDLTIYQVDSDSQHYLYWSGFWGFGILGGILGGSVVKSS